MKMGKDLKTDYNYSTFIDGIKRRCDGRTMIVARATYRLFLMSSAAPLAFPLASSAVPFALPLSSSAAPAADLLPVTDWAAFLALVPAYSVHHHVSRAPVPWARESQIASAGNLPAASMPSTILPLTALSTVLMPSLTVSVALFWCTAVEENARGALRVATRGTARVADRSARDMVTAGGVIGLRGKTANGVL